MIEHSMYNQRIVFITEDLSFPIDEGMKKFNYAFVDFIVNHFSDFKLYVSKADNQLVTSKYVSRRSFKSLKFYGEIRNFAPQLIVYSPLSSGTLASFIRLYLLKLTAKQDRAILINLQRRKHGFLGKVLIKLIRPPQVVVFSRRDFNYFKLLKTDPVFCKTGVDLDRFKPVSAEMKAKLRSKYGINLNDRVFLHIGHLNKGRNIESMKALVENHNYVLIVGSTSTDVEVSLRDDLIKSGIDIRDTYIENIEELYQLSDVYIFPVKNDHSAIEFPLSVLEAMACNLPVITTPFGSLPDHFKQTGCFVYLNDFHDLKMHSENIVKTPCTNRRIASQFSWNSVLKDLITNLRANDYLFDRY